MVVALAVPVTNTNPTVSTVGEGKQAITLHDSELGNRRTVVTSKEECEKYIKEQKSLKKEASLKTARTALLSALGGAGLGGLIGLFKGKSDTKVMNTVIEECNAMLKAGKSYYDVIIEQGSKFFGKSGNILTNFYNKAANTFNKVGNSKIKQSVLTAATIGAGCVAFVGSLVGAYKHYKPVEASTQDFIKNNS